MRLAVPHERLDCTPITAVYLNLNCRDEIIPILRALQHLYEDVPLRRKVLEGCGPTPVSIYPARVPWTGSSCSGVRIGTSLCANNIRS
jgi:hypothetical protein